MEETRAQAMYGIHPVKEALESGKQIEKILLKQGMDHPALRDILQQAERKGIPVQFVPVERLVRLAKGGNHQGVAAYLAQIDYLSLEEAVDTVLTTGPEPLVVLLDGVSDVRNLGAIARSAECTGAGALIVPAKGGAALNAEAIKSSAGALLRVPVAKVSNLRVAIYYLKQLGFTVVGITEKAQDLLYQGSFQGPVALVMGAEGKGISPALLPLCDKRLRIPMQGAIGSLNVSAAAAMALYEVLRQRSIAQAQAPKAQ